MPTHDRDLNESIGELLALVPISAKTIVEEACRQNLLLNPQVERSKFRINDRVHRYGPEATTICGGGQTQRVFDEMLKDGRCSAPTSSSAPIYSRKIETLFPFGDMVVKFVDRSEFSVYNITLPKHILFPGVVKLVVQEVGGKTVVAVSGWGKGNWMWANTVLGPILFREILTNHLVPKLK